METFEETAKSITSKNGFIKHVFNFEDDSKSEMLNIIQYSLLAIIPIIILNKLSQKFVPEAEEEKGSFEILAEVVVQVLVIFLGLLLINRIITYIPTYSGMKYPEVNIIYIILAVLMITLSLQTKLGEKVGILTDRVMQLWDGYGEMNQQGNGKGNANGNGKGNMKGNVRVSQPISGQMQMQPQMQPQMQSQMQSQNDAMNQSLYSTPISQLPTIGAEQKTPDYNSMYQNTYTPLPGAATPGFTEPMEPMAANAAGAFASPFGGGF